MFRILKMPFLTENRKLFYEKCRMLFLHAVTGRKKFIMKDPYKVSGELQSFQLTPNVNIKCFKI